jgi:hypothetical protein
VQLPGGSVEGAVIGDGYEGVKLARVEVHLPELLSFGLGRVVLESGVSKEGSFE